MPARVWPAIGPCLVVLLVLPATASAWKLEVERVEYNGVRMQVVAVATPGAGDEVGWIGLTACDADKTFDDEGFLATYDFKARKVAPGAKREVTFSADVGPDVDGYILAVWRRKVSKCKRDARRPGCKKWGYVLEDELATIPGSVYWMYPGGMDFKPGQAFWEVRLMAAGASPEDMERIRTLAEKFAKESRHGGKAKLAYRVTDGPKAKNPREKVQVLFRYKAEEDDADGLARALLDVTEAGVEVKHWPRAPAPLIVAVPKL